MNTTKPILQLVNEFVLNQDIRQNSKANYRNTLKTFVSWMVKTRVDVRNPQRVNILQYKEFLLTSGRSIRTVDSYLSSVRRFFKWLSELNIHPDIAAGVHSPRRGKPFVKGYLQPNHVQNLLNKPNQTTHIGQRDYAILSIMVKTAIRCVEVARLTINDLVLENGNYYINILRKGRSEKETIVIPPTTYDSINSYLCGFENIDPLPAMFVNMDGKPFHPLTEKTVGNIVTTYLTMAGYKSKTVTPHSIRHSAAINSLKSGQSIYDVMRMLGHTSTKTTEIYLRAIEAETTKDNPCVLALDKLYTQPEKTGKYQSFNTNTQL